MPIPCKECENEDIPKKTIRVKGKIRVLSTCVLCFKEIESIRKAEYYRVNGKKIRAANRKYAKKNREKIRANNRASYFKKRYGRLAIQ